MRKPEQELAEIKSMMERSTRFLSLSGLSGILAGTYALIAAGLAYAWVYYPNLPYGTNIELIRQEDILGKLLVTAAVVLLFSIGTAWLMSQSKSKKKAQKFWTPASKRFIQALFIPVAVGGIFCLAMLAKGYLGVVAPATLIFYGLGLLNASTFTLNDIKYLGYCQLVLGIISAFFTGYGLILWAVGFGVLHIIYGAMMYYKYDR
ncbi:hypothetical protein PBT90_05055 [Algoriphagus halophytocola]|uniref:Uncharacterized protein n=1 Tax=Algoriphagus halophytocola TaxID=2991499 RepID=A0ABY6MJD6_9BACT|nr:MULTISPECIES: hypothetical protein [unclassified Algoriphagus]UZD22786.1 hypothetical protein OM944_19315 [Algoriphagus sp. TR-M5]WBL44052.1 hypothetical protein PBT90_05055 [Algoriphagus sp. TR-M9]